MRPNVRKTITLNPNHLESQEVPQPLSSNSINYRGKSNHSKYLLKHIRNSFAHGLIESRGNDFYLLDIPPGKENEKDFEKVASMIGIMNKNTFYEMIKAILATNPLTKNML